MTKLYKEGNSADDREATGSSNREFPFLTIAVPSFNRPEGLSRLLQSVDCDASLVEVLVVEDCAPRRQEVRRVVTEFQKGTKFQIRYFENEDNLGFDANVRRIFEMSLGKYVLLMGDDDAFHPGMLSELLDDIKEHPRAKYFLRAYWIEHPGGRIEPFRYLSSATDMPPGLATATWMFKRSVSLSGFTISREAALRHSTSALDGTLLYQVYVMSAVCLESPSRYPDIPIARVTQSFRTHGPMFGNSKSERSKYTPGEITMENSINFTKSYLEVCNFIDAKFGTTLTDGVRQQLSKYSYPFLSIQRKRGRRAFLRYSRLLADETRIDSSVYFHIYKWSLVVLGEDICDRAIFVIKLFRGRTPNL